MKEDKLVKDVMALMHMTGKDWKEYTIRYFIGDSKTKLFNAFYNKQFTYDIDETLTAKITDVISYGRKLFSLKVYESRCGNFFHVFKETKTKSVFMEFRIK